MPATVIRLASGDFSQNSVGFFPGLLATKLIRPSALDSAMTFTRAHTPAGASATRQDAAGLFAEVAQNAARYTGSTQRLAVAGARTNLIRNPRLEGAAAGSPGTMPTHWPASFSGAVSGMSRTIVGTGIEDGIPYIDVEYSGTPSAANGYIVFDAITAGIAQGVTMTHSVFVRLVGGSTANLTSLRVGMTEYNGSGTYLTEGNGNILGSISGAALRSQRYSHTRSLANASVADVRPYIRYDMTTGQPVSFRLRIGAPQAELATFATLPMLPPAASPQAVTRSADLPVWTPSGGWPAAGTLVLAYVAPQTAPTGLDQGLLQVDDTTDNNRLVLRNFAGGLTRDARVISGGVTQQTFSLGSHIAGTLSRVALAWDATGIAVAATGVSTVQTWVGALPPGLVRALAGHSAADGSRALFGEVETLHRYATRLPASSLLAAVA